jgi:hypothetical protein
MARSKFARDMDRLLDKLSPNTDPDVLQQLNEICEALIGLNQRRLVKINHSIMEVICAKYLIEQGYEVKVEHPLEGGPLSADIFAKRVQEKQPTFQKNQTQKAKKPVDDTVSRKGETLLVEVETGFVPPEGALSPGLYRQARIATKIARYSGHAQKFALATPNYHVVQVPNVLLSPPEMRSEDELQELKGLCDSYYYSPSIPIETLAKVELNAIYILDVDFDEVIPTTPDQYLETVLKARGWIGF